MTARRLDLFGAVPAEQWCACMSAAFEYGTLPNLFALLRRARVGVAIIFVLAIAGGLAYALLMPRTYRAQVVLSPVAERDGDLGALLGQFGGLASLAGMGGLSLGGAQSSEPTAVLSSREFARGFILENELLQELFPRKWDERRHRWKSDDPDDIPTLEDGVKKFVEQVRSVKVDELGGLITLTVDWRDREKVARWANAMVARVNRVLRERAIDEAESSLKYLYAEAEKTSVQPLRDAIYRVVESQVKLIMLARIRDDYAFKVIDPAVVPDVNRHIWPRAAVVLAVAMAIAFLLSLLLVYWVHLSGRVKQAYRESAGIHV